MSSVVQTVFAHTALTFYAECYTKKHFVLAVWNRNTVKSFNFMDTIFCGLMTMDMLMDT